jgi:hypothetical protein
LPNRLPYPPPFQDLATLALHVSVAESTIENWVKLGQFPGPVKKVGGKNLWWWREVEGFLSNREAMTQSADEQGVRIREATRRAAQGR